MAVSQDPGEVREDATRWGDALAGASLHGFGTASPVPSWNYARLIRDRIWVRVLFVAALLIGMAWFAVLDFNDHAFREYSGSAAAYTTVGSTVYIGTSIAPTADHGQGGITVNLRTVSPRVAENGADATVRVFVCSGSYVGSLLSGGATPAAADLCTTLTPAQRGTTHLESTTGFVLAVTPHRAGTVRIDGADLHYWRGIHFGHQHVGARLTITAS